MKQKLNAPLDHDGSEESTKYTHEKDWNMESNRPIIRTEAPGKETSTAHCDGLTFRQPL